MEQLRQLQLKELEMLKLFTKAYIAVVKEAETTKFNNMKEYYKIKGEKKLKKLKRKNN